MKKLVLFICFLTIFCITACETSDKHRLVANVEYSIKYTDDEYGWLHNCYECLLLPEEEIEKLIYKNNGTPYYDLGKLDYSDVYVDGEKNLPLKKSITSILKLHADEKWTEAGNGDCQLEINVDEDGMTARIINRDNKNELYRFVIDSEQLEVAERYNYLTYEMPQSDETIYFYCRRDDVINVRVISGNCPSDYILKSYSFVPEDSQLQVNSDMDLQDITMHSANKFFDINPVLKLSEEDNVISGKITIQDYKYTGYYIIKFSGIIKDGVLEYSDYERQYVTKDELSGDYIQQGDLITGLDGKVFFYRTFILFEDAYTGEEYTFSYDKIK